MLGSRRLSWFARRSRWPGPRAPACRPLRRSANGSRSWRRPGTCNNSSCVPRRRLRPRHIRPLPAPPFRSPNRRGAPEWSGQPGSSGHPLMTTEAILRGGREFRQLPGEAVAGSRAARRHPGDLRGHTTPGLSPDLRIMDLMDAQPEFTKAFWDYLDLLVNDTRIKRGQEILAQHRAIFDASREGSTASTAISSWRSGGSNRISAPRAAIGR